jgi:signal transduction histidine kinase
MALASDLDLDRVLRRFVETAAALTEARYAALGVIGSGPRRLERFITNGLSQSEIQAIGDLPQGRGLLGVLIDHAEPLRLTEITADPRSVGFPPNHPPMRSFLGVPVLLRGVAYGNLYLTEKADGEDFTADDQEIVELLAAQAAVAIDLSQRVSRDTFRRSVAAQEVERKRFARELHDETGQALTSILLKLSSAESAATLEETRETLADLRELVVATLQDVRRLAVELRPSALDDFGLVPALTRLGQGTREASGLDVQVEARLGPSRLPSEIETAAYRIVQEALTNAVKHARATHVSIVLSRTGDTLAILVEDDGRGFDVGDAGEGLGLVGMRERVELAAGTFLIESSPGAGTTIRLQLPIS